MAPDKDQIISELRDRIESLEIRLRHLTNDHRLMQDEHQTAVSKYLEVFGAMERLVAERTEALARSQQFLEQKSQELQMMLDSSPAMIFYKDTAGRYVRVNKLFAETLDLKITSIIGRRDSELGWGMTEHGAEDERRVMETGSPILKRSDRMLASKGTLDITIDRFPYRDIHGAILGVMGFAVDVTEAARAAEERRILEDQLHRAQKMESLGVLAGGVAHDLNNRFTPLIGYAELVLLQLPPGSPLRASIDKIRRSAEDAAEIVQDLLTLARRGVPKKEPLSINKIIAEYLESPDFSALRELYPGVTVETALDPNLLSVCGSKSHLSKTIMNLARNAVEAMPHGGTLKISTRNRYLDTPIPGCDSIREGDYVVITVADTGVGIAREDRKRIFEPFFTKKAMGRSGSGLGMAVVWGAVRDHDGYIDLDSEPGAGAEFRVYLPATRQPEAPPPGRAPLTEYEGSGQSVLVVDDAEPQREVASQILERLGYKVAAVSSGEEAVDFVRKHAVDALLLDMIMEGGMDGCETYRRIAEFRPGQRAVIVSGYAETDRVREAQRLGAGAYVKKPYTMENLGLALKAELAKVTTS
ncbi:MAG TPA: response regulator [Candidatus Brocadiia bacterium]|nr:response regulator [Candidatus Brocadiia bacterium]